MRAYGMGLLMITTLALASAANATELRIAYVDVKSAVENTKAYRAGIKKLQAMQAQKQKELDALRKRIEQAEKELMAKSMVMSPDQLDRKQKEINDLRKQFSRKMQDAKDELAAEKNRLDMTVGSKFQKVIRKLGKQGGYDFIFGQPILLYADPKHDVTQQVTKMLDQN